MQAQDGCMHVHVFPAGESSKDTYPVYSRGILPQPVMPVSECVRGPGGWMSCLRVCSIV